MKRPNPPENDRQLSDLLQEWKPQASMPPRLQDRVWKQIERAEARKSQNLLAALLQWIDAAFRRPAFATVYVAALLVVGLSAGYWQAQDQSSRADSELRALYVQSVNPYQAPRN